MPALQASSLHFHTIPRARTEKIQSPGPKQPIKERVWASEELKDSHSWSDRGPSEEMCSPTEEEGWSSTDEASPDQEATPCAALLGGT